MKRIILVVTMAGGIVLGGCSVQPPADAFRLNETSLQDRQVQSRFYETGLETELLSAGVAVLQDMGYTLDETERVAGLITASKTVDAIDGGQVALAIFAAALGGGSTVYDTEQLIKVSFVTYPSRVDVGFVARASFQRVVRNNQGGISRVETLAEPELYEEFFDKLSKSVFLEGQVI
jgi:hypothetical protein